MLYSPISNGDGSILVLSKCIKGRRPQIQGSKTREMKTVPLKEMSALLQKKTPTGIKVQHCILFRKHLQSTSEDRNPSHVSNASSATADDRHRTVRGGRTQFRLVFLLLDQS